jgi:hypothetical protein
MAAEVEGVLMAFGLVLVLEAVGTVGACVLLFRFVKSEYVSMSK